MKVDLLLKLIQRLQAERFIGSLTIRFHYGDLAKHVEHTTIVNLLPDDRHIDKEISHGR